MNPTEMRREMNSALAKAIAFKQCGQHDKAEFWAVALVQMLCVEGVLRGPYVTVRNPPG